MNLDQLKQRLGAQVELDLPSLFARYRTEAKSEDLDGFVSYLVKARILDAAAVTELYAQTDVELGPAPAVSPTLLSGRSGRADAAPGRHATPDAGSMADVETAIGGFSGPEANASIPRPDPQEARYEPIARLGQGAMGAVDVARDIHLRRRVALKTVLPAMASHRALVDRFLSEMQITAQLEHPNIVPVYALEVGADGALGYAMKLVAGKDLAELLADARALVKAGDSLPSHLVLEQRLEIFLKVCDALEYAHAKGIVHRDLKPSNVMVGKHHEVYLMDWGIARPMGAGGQAIDAGIELASVDGDVAGMRTRVGATVGTPAYMSPEQASGRNHELDGRSDQYTMGLILQECLTLEQAVRGKTVEDVLHKAREARRDPLPEGGQDSPMWRELVAIVEKATARGVEARYPTIAALAAEVRLVLRNEPITALPDGPLRGATRWISRHRAASFALMMALALLGAIATIVTQRTGQARLDALHASELRQSELETESAIAAGRLDRKLARHEIAIARLAGAVQATLATVPEASVGAALEPALQEALLDSAAVHARVVLASGATIALPAEGPRLDATSDPPYLAASLGRGVHWSNPYERGPARVLPLSTAVHDGAALGGVVVLEIAMNRLLQEQDPLELDYVQTRLLLARDGTVHAELNGSGGRAPLAREVADAVAAGRSGSLEYDGEGRRWMATYHALTALDWSYVSIADMGRMLTSSKALVSTDARATPSSATAGTAVPVARPAPPPASAASVATEPPASASAPVAAPPASLGGPRPRPAAAPPSAAPSPPASVAPNPFDKWDVYKK